MQIINAEGLKSLTTWYGRGSLMYSKTARMISSGDWLAQRYFACSRSACVMSLRRRILNPWGANGPVKLAKFKGISAIHAFQSGDSSCFQQDLANVPSSKLARDKKILVNICQFICTVKCLVTAACHTMAPYPI